MIAQEQIFTDRDLKRLIYLRTVRNRHHHLMIDALIRNLKLIQQIIHCDLFLQPALIRLRPSLITFHCSSSSVQYGRSICRIPYTASIYSMSENISNGHSLRYLSPSFDRPPRSQQSGQYSIITCPLCSVKIPVHKKSRKKPRTVAW